MGEPQGVAELPRLGSSKGIKSIPAQYLERTVLRRLARHGVPMAAPLRDRLNQWNRGLPPTMLDETRSALAEKYQPDLQRLTALTGIDVLGAQAATRSDQ